MRARDLAKELDTTANRIALAWLTNQTFPGIAIIGPKRPDQLADSLLAGDVELTSDQVEWLTGLKISEVSAYSHPDRRLGKPDDTVAILGMLGADCHVVVRASREIAFAENDLRVQGTLGMLATSALRWEEEHVLRIKTAAGLVEERFAATANYQRQIEAFAQEVRGGPRALASGEDGIRAIQLASAVLESIQTRRSVAT